MAGEIWGTKASTAANGELYFVLNVNWVFKASMSQDYWLSLVL
jgi:hypothetical protein